MRRGMILAASALLSSALFASAQLAAQGYFPHEKHSAFFSDCSVCHGGITSGVQADPYPDPSICMACHDGSTAPSISWKKPEPRASNLGFTHVPHEFGCAFCHQPEGAEGLTAMVFPKPELCLGCHAPQATGHLEATGMCLTCHVPIGKSRLAVSAALEFPAPESHGKSDFASAHGPLAATSPGDCTVCHDRSSCTTCHGGATHLPTAILEIPLPVEGGPQGVQPPQRSSGFHPADWVTSHAAEAAAGQPDCMSCHAESTCVSCHDGPRAPSFHPMNFLASHGPEAFGRVSDCTSCHSSEAFCRECHLGLGIQGSGGVVAPFHDNQALWVLSHPQAARQDLESCVTCHRQTDCLRCHSATSGLRINPHGPDFDPSRISDRNQAMCIVCHLSGGGGG
jgi:predicted CXXCH cytochrome family protein